MGLIGTLARASVRISDLDSTGTARRVMTRAYAKNRARRAKTIAAEYGLQLLIPEHRTWAQNSQGTMFILGSGSSVNDLTQADFRHIDLHTSIGFNAWPVHDFVPSVYAFERFGRSPHKARMVAHALHREEVFRRSPMVFVGDDYLRAPRQQQLGPFLFSSFQVLVYGPLPIATSRVSHAFAAIDDMVRLRREGQLPLSLVPGIGASVERLTAIAAFGGHLDIVLVGVDLTDVNYFWDVDATFLANRGIERLDSGQIGAVHRTNDPAQTRLPVTATMPALAKVLRERLGVKVWIGSPRSALADYLDVYPWRERREDG